MIARALATGPEVLLLDEPTSALDERARDSIEQTVADLRERLGASIVIVTHDPAQAARLADWIVRIDSGQPRRGGPGGGDGAMSSSIDVTVGEVVASLVLVAIAAGISRWRRAGLEEDIGIAVVRSFLQLTAVGFVITAIFEQDSLLMVVALLAVMVGFGSWTARARARHVPGALGPLAIALTLSAVATLGLVLALGIFPAEPRYLVPVGGMVIGNAMTASAVALNRLGDEMRGDERRIEATLALGATARQAASPASGERCGRARSRSSTRPRRPG